MELSDYCTGVVEKVQAYASHIGERASEEFQQFAAHPLKYTGNAAWNFVKNYWDMGAAMLTGFAWMDYQAQVTSALLHSQELGLRVNTMCMVLPAIASLIGAGLHGMKEYDQGGDRFLRNLAACFATGFHFYNLGVEESRPAWTQSAHDAIALFFLSGGYVLDQARRAGNARMHAASQSAANSQAVPQ